MENIKDTQLKSKSPIQRDVFIEAIYQAALKDRDILLLSADFSSRTIEKGFLQNIPNHPFF